MFRAIHFCRVVPAGLFPFLENRNENDIVQIGTPINVPKTGIERVKKMYSRDDMEEISMELHTVIQGSMVGAFFGAAMGGLVRSREAYLYFIENNQATIFTTTLEAKKKLQDYVTIAFAKGAVFWGWRLALFTGIYGIVSTTMSVYRGDVSLLDYVTAGVVAGGLYRMNLGLAGTLVGAGLGGALSVFGGGAIMLILAVTGVSMDDIRKALYSIKEARENQYNEAIEKASTVKNDELTMHHDVLVEQIGVKKIEDI